LGNKVADSTTIKKILRRVAGEKLDAKHRSFHPFPARMPLELARTLISELTQASAMVLDPMLGSGTTAIASRMLGRSCLGTEIDPMAVALSRTATTYYSTRNLADVRDEVFDGATSILKHQPFRLSLDRLRMSDDNKQFIQYWFPEQSQSQLFALAKSIGRLQNSRDSRLAWTVFSSLIIAKRATASYATDISRTRPRRNFEKAIVLPFYAWHRRFYEAETRLPFVGHKPAAGAKCTLLEGDARSLPFSDNSVDFVLTSPPYLNAIDYLRSHRMSLVWMGHDLSDIRELRGTMCGSERGMWQLDGLPAKLEQRLESEIFVPRHRAVLRRYLADLRLMLHEINRVLSPGGTVIMALGPNLLAKDIEDTTAVVRQLSRQAGLQFLVGVPREIDALRRSLPPPEKIDKASPLGLRMQHELMVALRKPD